jgi:uncharacterized protein (UPF0332 family)
MTIPDDDRQALIALRLANAATMLEDARCLLERGSLRSAANRAYYSAFYAVSALALREGKTFRTHTGLISYLHSDFVASGRLEPKYGRVVQEAFEDRSEADYEDVPDISREQIAVRLGEMADLVQAIRRIVAGHFGV